MSNSTEEMGTQIKKNDAIKRLEKERRSLKIARNRDEDVFNTLFERLRSGRINKTETYKVLFERAKLLLQDMMELKDSFVFQLKTPKAIRWFDDLYGKIKREMKISGAFMRAEQLQGEDSLEKFISKRLKQLKMAKIEMERSVTVRYLDHLVKMNSAFIMLYNDFKYLKEFYEEKLTKRGARNKKIGDPKNIERLFFLIEMEIKDVQDKIRELGLEVSKKKNHRTVSDISSESSPTLRSASTKTVTFSNQETIKPTTVKPMTLKPIIRK